MSSLYNCDCHCWDENYKEACKHCITVDLKFYDGSDWELLPQVLRLHLLSLFKLHGVDTTVHLQCLYSDTDFLDSVQSNILE